MGSKTPRIKGEKLLALHIFAAGLPVPQREYRWAAEHVKLGRGVRERLKGAGLQDWRFDFAWPELMVAMEVDGGTWSRGRHVRGKGFEGDCRKCNEAQLRGWCVLRVTTDMVASGEARDLLERVIGWASEV